MEKCCSAITHSSLSSCGQKNMQSGVKYACLKVWLNRYSWGAGKLGSEYNSWFIWLECISWRFLTMSRLSKCLYNVRSCRNSSEYSKTAGNFLPLLIIRLVQKIVWQIFNIISSDAALPIFNLGLWCFSSRDILIRGGGSPCHPLISKNIHNIKKTESLALIMKISSANLCVNLAKNGGRRLLVVKHECYAKLSVITYLKVI